MLPTSDAPRPPVDIIASPLVSNLTNGEAIISIGGQAASDVGCTVLYLSEDEVVVLGDGAVDL